VYFEFVFQTERRRSREDVPEYHPSLCLLVCCSYKNHMRFNHFHVIVIYRSVDETPCFKIVGAYLKKDTFLTFYQLFFWHHVLLPRVQACAFHFRGREQTIAKKKARRKTEGNTGCFLTTLTSIHLRKVSFSVSSKIFIVM